VPYHNLGHGRFADVPVVAGVADTGYGMGCTCGDFDNDGAVDIVVVNKDGPAYVLHNIAPKKGTSRQFRLVNREGADAIGARYKVQIGKTQRTAEHYPSYGYCSSNDPRIHVGLAEGETVDALMVHWGGGTWKQFNSTNAVPVQTIHEGEGKPFDIQTKSLPR